MSTDYSYPPAFDQETPHGEKPHQAEMLEGKSLMPAYGEVRAWHRRFVSGHNDPNAGSPGAVSLFRMTPDTEAPPPSAEHRIVPPQLGLDPGEMALRPRRELWTTTQLDPDMRILSNPLRSIISEVDEPAKMSAAVADDTLLAVAGGAVLLMLVFLV
jgi:hypothetical protein